MRIDVDRLAKFLSKPDAEDAWPHRMLESSETGKSLQLTPAGILDLASAGHWIYIPSSRIDDKSKGDWIQKSLVLLQVSWMATTCIARKLANLPISLLELHTMVHVVCAITMYLFWFQVSSLPSEAPSR